MSRKLATIKKIAEIHPIEGADAIEVALVDSWKVVVRKEEVKVGSLVVYFEIDSWIPSYLAPFLSKGKPPKVYNEIEGEKLRTIKLRGQISQGLIINIDDIIKLVPDFETKVPDIKEDMDVTDILGITKWELPSSMSSHETKGSFPSFIPKTDQERIQNLTKKFDKIKNCTWEVTEKYDGSSMTVYVNTVNKGKDNQETLEGVCSRNLDLKMEVVDEHGNTTVNSYWEIAIREKLIEKIKASGLNLALQGELVGVKIGPNIYKLTGRYFYLFDIYDIDNGRYYSPMERQEFAKKYDIDHVPVLFNDYVIPEISVAELLIFAEGKSVLNGKVEREGIVFKNMTNDLFLNSFKAISNKYLLKTDG
jgi:RNA ligase (TIGR02306 family)